VRNVKTAPPRAQDSGSSDGVLDRLAGVFQQTLSLKFFHVGSGHHDAYSGAASLQRNVAGEHAADSSRNFSSNVEQPIRVKNILQSRLIPSLRKHV